MNPSVRELQLISACPVWGIILIIQSFNGVSICEGHVDVYRSTDVRSIPLFANILIRCYYWLIQCDLMDPLWAVNDHCSVHSVPRSPPLSPLLLLPFSYPPLALD